MSAVVFLGPSLARAEATSRLDAEFLPPIKRGDIDALLARERRPLAIGIVDGAFLQGPSISPKEVLRAIDQGIKVFGSSSMGALRAAECAVYGMIGIGRVFEAYHSERIEADDEVAITYDSATHKPLSEPLINIRFAIEAAVAAGATTEPIAERFLAIAKKLYFPDRSVKAVLHLISRELEADACARLRQFLTEDAPDTKRDDAIQLLDAMRAHLAGSRDVS